MGVMLARRLMLVTVVSSCSLASGLSLSASVALAMTPPVVEEESVLNVAGTSATLQAQINPEGTETTYRFEYDTSEYSSNAPHGVSAPSPEASAGAGSGLVSVEAHVQGLTPATLYHFRMVATNAAHETAYGKDQTFTTQPAGGELALPDNRQWELVSQPNKHGATIYPVAESGVIQAAADGSAITFLTNAPTELEPKGFSNLVQVLSTRGAGGWGSQDIATPHNAATSASVGQGYEYRFFSSDLSLALVEPQGLFTALSAQATERTPYVREDATCNATPATCYTPVASAGDVRPGAEFGGNPEYLRGAVEFSGATPDLNHVVVNSSVGLTTTTGDNGGLYEWTAGQLRLISILPEGEGGKPVNPLTEPPQLGGNHNPRNAIASNGSRVFWSDHFGEQYVYMRDNEKNETLRIGSGNRVQFQIANSDGSRVFFIEEGNLDVCDVVEVAGKLSCKTASLAEGVQGAAPGASEDGSYVYFVSTDALAPKAVSGGDNLYVDHNTGTAWEGPVLIATLSAEDSNDWNLSLNDLTARVSPNGHWFAFMSRQNLTGYDNRDANSGEPDEEVFLYDAVHNSLVCASCNPTGARPAGMAYGEGVHGKHGLLGGGDRVWPETTWLAANIPAWTPYSLGESLYQSSYLSNSGRLFFNSSDALVPQDVNGTWDVYEYEPEAVGSCGRSSVTFSEVSDGCVGLISSGDSIEQSAFMDASETGEDVFFLTTSQLVPQDFDTSYDIYDARVCSALRPCVSPSVSPPSCSTGDACKAAPSPQPGIFGSPSSATFAGAGNVVPPASNAVAGPRSLTRAQKLARALSACRRERRKKRAACARRARKQYRAKQSRRAKATRGGHR